MRIGISILAWVLWAFLAMACDQGRVSVGDGGDGDGFDGSQLDGDDGGGDAGADVEADGGADGGPDDGADGDVDDGADGGSDDGADGGEDGGTDGGEDGGDGDLLPGACQPLPPPEGAQIAVGPDQADQLRQIVLDAAAGTTILLADGTYALDGGDASHRLSFYRPDVTLRSASGDPAAVVLDGGWVTGEIISISASRVTIAELTVTRAYYHPIHITGGDTQNTDGVRIYRVRVIDPAEQGIKINTGGGGSTYADGGRVSCCRIELTDAGRSRVRNNCYTGGIDAHQARAWRVDHNFIRGFFCESGLSEHGVHFWVASRDTLVEDNTIVDCARGIGFGLGESGNGDDRIYADDPYPEIDYIGHYDGIIRNNFISATGAVLASGSGFDSGIALEQAHGSQVVHNTVFSSQAPFSSIEWRWPNTTVSLRNNLVSHNLRDRGGEASLANNVLDAPASWFVDAPAGDLHLVPQAAGAIDQGGVLPAGLCDVDLDGQARDALPDVGADELGE